MAKILTKTMIFAVDSILESGE